MFEALYILKEKTMTLKASVISFLFVLVLHAGSVNAAFVVIDHSVDMNFLDEEVNFSITFSEFPDFFTIDSFGRQADEFQYYFDSDSEITGPFLDQDLADRIIRGGEIHVEGDLRIREGLGGASDPDPNSGGWGSIVGSVNYSLNDRELSFTVPWDVLGEDDGEFTYALLLVEFGGSTDEVFYPAQIPLPSAFWLFGSGLLGLLGFYKKRHT